MDRFIHVEPIRTNRFSHSWMVFSHRLVIVYLCLLERIRGRLFNNTVIPIDKTLPHDDTKNWDNQTMYCTEQNKLKKRPKNENIR